jgi:hypothetical protein
MRILTSQYTGTTTFSEPAPSVTTDGSYTVVTWTSTGTTGVVAYTA